MPVLTHELTLSLASAFVDGEHLDFIFTSPTVDIFAVGIVVFGWLLLRLECLCDSAPEHDRICRPDWDRAVAQLPAGLAIEPDDWEAHPVGIESIFVPAQRTSSVLV